MTGGELLDPTVVDGVVRLLASARVPVDSDPTSVVLGCRLTAPGTVEISWLVWGARRRTEFRFDASTYGDSDAEGIVDMVRYELAESVEARDA